MQTTPATRAAPEVRETSSRIDAVDLARGFAALSVVVFHFNVGPALARVTGLPFLSVLSFPGLALAVPLLVAISGFCIHLGWLTHRHGPWSTRSFFAARFWRIYPAWFVTIVLSAAVASVAGAPPRPMVIVHHLALINGFFNDYSLNFVLWTVSLEACLYVLYPLWLGLRKRFGTSNAFLTALAVSVLSTACASYFSSASTGPLLWLFTNVWVGWVAGAVLAETWVRSGPSHFKRLSWWLACLPLVLAYAALSSSHVLPLAKTPLLVNLAVWPLSLFLISSNWFATTPIFRLPSQAVTFVGRFSYSLYLLHMPMLGIRLEMERVLPANLGLKAILYILWTGLILFTAWASWRWIECPFIRLGRSRPKPASPSLAQS